jgi:hypothetical protein
VAVTNYGVCTGDRDTALSASGATLDGLFDAGPVGYVPPTTET